MIYAGILAGGRGKRMGYTEMPKQFLLLRGKPILIHTLEKFLLNPRFHGIYIGAVVDWVSHTRDIVAKYIGDDPRIQVVEGGTDRNGTIMNILSYIEETRGLEEEDIIVTHDAVRPFVTHRIIEENIQAALECGACDTAIPATDTIVRSLDGKLLLEIPPRPEYYQGQTPQSFHIRRLRENFDSLTKEERGILTDACKICVLRGDVVKMVQGEVFNIKVTTPYDLKIAEAILEEDICD